MRYLFITVLIIALMSFGGHYYSDHWGSDQPGMEAARHAETMREVNAMHREDLTVGRLTAEADEYSRYYPDHRCDDCSN
jgi:hypothetical protein